MKLTVRVYKEIEVQVDNNLTEEVADNVAVDLALEKIKMSGINPVGFDVAILREVTTEQKTEEKETNETNKFDGAFMTIDEEGMGWRTVEKLIEALSCYDDDTQLCFVESTGEASEVDCDGENKMFAPFEFDIKDNVLYVPIYDGNILTFVKKENKN